MSLDLVLRNTRHNWARGSAPSRATFALMVFEASSRSSSIGRENRAQRRARRLQHVQRLKTKAAAGDQQAIAKLQRMQADLGLPATTTPASATPASATPGSPTPAIFGTPSSTPGYPASTYPSTYPPAYPSAYQPGYPQSAYQPGYPQSAYQQQYAYQPQYAAQSPYYDPSLSQDPYGPPPQPTVDVYQGDSRLQGEEERELARDGGSSERSALTRTRRA